MGNCASTMRIMDSIELGLDDGVIKIEGGKKKLDKSQTRGDCSSGVFNKIFLSQYGVGNQVNSAPVQDTTLDEIFTLRSKLDQGQTRISKVNLMNNQTNVDQNTKNSPSPCLQRRFVDDQINSSSFEALILDLDEVTPYTSLCVGRRQAQEIDGFRFSISPYSETDYRKSTQRNFSPPSSHNSLRLVTRQISEEPKHATSGVTPKFKSHLAIHKHDPVNTSTGSSTSGVEISSVSSKSELLNGSSLPCVNSSSKLLYQPSYDPDDFLSPEDFENPLFIYRSLSFRRAIEEGNSSQSSTDQQHLSIVGALSNTSQRALKNRQDSSYFHVSQDSGHAQSISLGSSLSIDGKLQPPLPSQSSFSSGILTDEPRPGKISLYYRQSHNSFGSQDESFDRFVWKSFTSEDSGFDPIQILETDLIADSAEDPFCRNHQAVELRVSPGRRRCLSTLTEEELTEAMSSGPYQPTHPFPFPAPSSSRGVNSQQPYANEGPNRLSAEKKSLPAPLAVTIHTSKREAETSPSADRAVAITEKSKCFGNNEQPPAIAKESDATGTKSVAGLDEDRAAERQEKTSILIKAKRKSLHEMRHLQNIATAEEPPAEREESEQTTSTDKQLCATNNNSCLTHFTDNLHQVEEEPSAPDDPSDEPSSTPFPSLTDELLQQVEPKNDAKTSTDPEDISLQESEEKFTSLALAFKTDRETLDKRIELHLRARDIAEQNIQKELEGLKDGIKVLNQSCNSGQSAHQTFAKIQTHLDVLEKSITRMSGRAELHGAVQQELRVSQVIETMLEHVENLKRAYETEHRELQEARKSHNETKQDGAETPGSSKVTERASFGTVGPGKGSLRRISLALMAKSPRLLRNTSLQVSDSCSTSSPAPPLQSQSLLFSKDNLVNSCDDSIVARGSIRNPQLNRQNRNLPARNDDSRSDAEAVKREDQTAPNGGTSKEDCGTSNKEGGTSKKDVGMDVSADLKPNSRLDQKAQTSLQYRRELQKHFLTWVAALLRLMLQCSSKVSIRKGFSFMFGLISKFQLLKVISPGLIAIVMFFVSATILLVIVWTRWMVSQVFYTS